MNEALVIYLILKLPVMFNLGVIFMILGVVGLAATFLMSDEYHIPKQLTAVLCAVSLVGLSFVAIFPSEKQANIMAIAYAGFEGIEAVKEMTGDSDITKNGIEAYNTMLEKYIEENTVEQE